MADIAAGDVTAQILWREMLTSPQGARKPLITVGVRITIDPGSSDAYPTGGVPLTSLFGSAGGVSDTKIDPSQPVVALGPGILRAAAGTLTPGLVCYHYDGGNTAASQTLVMMNVLADGGTNPTALAQLANSDITGTAASGFIGGDTDPVVEMVFIGRLREGEIL